MGEHAYAHVPVMAGRIAALLLPALTSPVPGGRPPVLIDATLGRAGHARAFLEAVPGLLLIGIDADAAAVEAGRALAVRYPGQVTVAHAFYDHVAEIAADAGHRRVQAVLFDLGVSSPQLDDASRGFSYSQDAPLDMRMDQGGELTAARVVNEYPVPGLARVLFGYGEEKFARRIAEAIARERAREPIAGTLRLSAIVTRPGYRSARACPASIAALSASIPISSSPGTASRRARAWPARPSVASMRTGGRPPGVGPVSAGSRRAAIRPAITGTCA